MEDLLPFYERELGYLRRHGKEFAERFPKIANRLLLSGEGSEDPHVERLIQSFALLTARVSKKIDDDYPEFTEALLEVLYPHYLRAFPSCSVAQFDLGPALAKLSAPLVIPRGTLLQSRPVKGVNCRFRTAYDVVLAPIRVTTVRYVPVAEAPLGTRLAAGSGGQVSISLEVLGDEPSLARLGQDRLRLFIDGEPSIRSALCDALGLDVAQAFVENGSSGKWTGLAGNPLSMAGFAVGDALIDFPDRAHAAYRLLSEFFAFPEKFSFFDLDLAALGGKVGARFTLHFVLKGDREPSKRHVLESIGTGNVRTGCTPVVNLFRMHGEPIRLTHEAVSYPVVADARRAYAYEVVSIDSVHRVRQTAQGEQVTRFRPFYSLHHGEDPDQQGHYWLARRNEDVARRSPGHETELTFVDLNFDPVLPQTDVVSTELTCSNRDLPTMLAYGVAGGDLTQEEGGQVRSIALLRKPGPQLRFARGRGAQWRLISHLSLNNLSLAGGVQALKEMLRLYDQSQSAVTRRLIDGITALEQVPATTWLKGQQYACVVRGVDIRLSIDESGFVGTGVAAFVGLMDRFFALYVHANSFTRLTLISAANGEVLAECPPRSGESILV